MFPYWLMLGVVAAGALQFGGHARDGVSRVIFLLTATLLTLTIGLRYNVGGDWVAYERIYADIYFLGFRDAIGQSDTGYAFLNWLAARLGAGVWFANLGCAAIFMLGITRLSLRQPSPFLALLVAIPYLVIVVAMGYTRQAAAIGFVCMGLAAVAPNRMIKVVVAIFFATLMHRSAVLAMLIVLVPLFRRNVLAAAVGAAAFAIVGYLLLRDSADTLITNYVQTAYDSQGALVRVLMNVLCAALFLRYRRHFGFDDFQLNYWTVCSIMSVVSLGALFVAAGSAGIDRIALFLIPLQMVVLARLPYLARDGSTNRAVLLGVVLYSFVVQAVWLFAANHARYWLPYRNMIEIWTA